MNITSNAASPGVLRRWAFADLPGQGRVPVNLGALDEAGWEAQRAQWNSASPKDIAELLEAARQEVSGLLVEAPPSEEPPNPVVAWEQEMSRLDALVTGDARYWEELAQGSLSEEASQRMNAVFALRAAHRASRPSP